ncbi:MAG: hypothetical protein AAFP03_17170, partial [Cyanobacteria bacterium J06598_3]
VNRSGAELKGLFSTSALFSRAEVLSVEKLNSSWGIVSDPLPEEITSPQEEEAEVGILRCLPSLNTVVTPDFICTKRTATSSTPVRSSLREYAEGTCDVRK